MLSDVPSATRFLVDVFSFVVHAELEVGVLAPEDFRWKIFLGEDLESLVALVCPMGLTRFSYHFKGGILTCISLKTNLSCSKFLMIAIFNGLLYYIFLKLKKVENSAP